MRFDIRTLDEITDDEREVRIEAERDARAEWDALTDDERDALTEAAGAAIPADVRWWR